MATHISLMLVDDEGQPYANYVANIFDEDKVTPALLYNDAAEETFKSVTGKVNLGSSGYLDVYLQVGNYYLYLKSPQGVVAYSRIIQVTEAGATFIDNSGNAGTPVTTTPPAPYTPPSLTEDALESLLTGLDNAPNTLQPGFLVKRGSDWYNATASQMQTWLNVEGAVGVVTFEYEFNYGDATPWEILILPANKTVHSIRVTIKTPFNDPDARLSIGDAGDAESLLSEEETFIITEGVFDVDSNKSFVSDTPIFLTLEPGISTQGRGLIVISYQR